MVSEDQFNARSQQQEAVGSVCPEGGSRDQLRSHMAPLPQLNMAWLQSILVLSTSETALWQGSGDKVFLVLAHRHASGCSVGLGAWKGRGTDDTPSWAGLSIAVITPCLLQKQGTYHLLSTSGHLKSGQRKAQPGLG